MRFLWLAGCLLGSIGAYSNGNQLVEWSTYDACLGERVEYNCTVKVENCSEVALTAFGIRRELETNASKHFIFCLPVLSAHSYGVFMQPTAVFPHKVTFKTTLAQANKNLILLCGTAELLEDEIEYSEYPLHTRVRPISPKSIGLSFHPGVMQIHWSEATDTCNAHQVLALHRDGQQLFVNPEDGRSLSVSSRALSPGNYTFVYEGYDEQGQVSRSTHYFELQLPSASSLQGQIAPLNDSFSELKVNWTNDPVIPELLSVYLRLDTEPPTRLSPESSFWCQTVSNSQEYIVRVFGENWLGNGSASVLTLGEMGNGSAGVLTLDETENSGTPNLPQFALFISLASAIIAAM